MMLLFILCVSFVVHPIQSELVLNITTAFSNIKSVISCGLSIDVYSSFNPKQVSICPYVSIDEKQLQLIYMNISFNPTTNQMIIYSNPSLNSTPQFLTKLSNNSFISPINFNHQSTIYVAFSSELICRWTIKTKQTICFYYLQQSKDFFLVESHYDYIQRGNLILPYEAKIRYYTIYFLISIVVFLVCSFAIALLCTKEISIRETSKLDWMIDTRMAREENAKRSAGETGQDAGQLQHIHMFALDELANRNTIVNSTIDG